MLICPMIMICIIDFFGEYDLKISKIGRCLTFLTYNQGFPNNNNIMEIPLDTCGGGIFFSITSIIYYFRIQTTTPS